MFRDKMGNVSSKRITGFSLLVYSVIMYTLGAVGLIENEAGLFLPLLGAGTTLLGIGVAERNK
jgi:hypothetical protein